jgi:hypothetical protein
VNGHFRAENIRLEVCGPRSIRSKIPHEFRGWHHLVRRHAQLIHDERPQAIPDLLIPSFSASASRMLISKVFSTSITSSTVSKPMEPPVPPDRLGGDLTPPGQAFFSLYPPVIPRVLDVSPVSLISAQADQEQ